MSPLRPASRYLLQALQDGATLEWVGLGYILQWPDGGKEPVKPKVVDALITRDLVEQAPKGRFLVLTEKGRTA